MATKDGDPLSIAEEWFKGHEKMDRCIRLLGHPEDYISKDFTLAQRLEITATQRKRLNE